MAYNSDIDVGWHRISTGTWSLLYALRLPEHISIVIDIYDPTEQRVMCAKISTRDESPEN